MSTMKTLLMQTPLAGIALLLFVAAPTAMAQNIYKCVKSGQVAYTDHPCPGASGELIHKADDADVIDQYLRLGQDKLAKQYADSHHLQALYKERVAAHQRNLDEKADREANEQMAARQRAEQQQQQTEADAIASRERLRDENEALRQENDSYRDQLDAPVYNQPPAYWGSTPSYGYGDYDRPRPHRPHRPDSPQPSEPVFHPCTQLAGGRVNC